MGLASDTQGIRAWSVMGLAFRYLTRRRWSVALTSEPVAKMCIIKLAKQIAKRRGLRGGKGGWLYRPNGKPHCQGYFQYAMRLVRNGDIAGVEFDGKGNRIGFIVPGRTA